MTSKVLRFPEISGLCSKKNDLLVYCKNKSSSFDKLVVYFGGDLQVL